MILTEWVVDHGYKFATGVPVTFPYVRNTEKSPYFGKEFQQDIEPAGRFMLLREDVTSPELPGWEYGTVTFRYPLVLAFNSDLATPYQYNATNWKAYLSKLYKAKGRKLSQRLIDAGYDGIVTVGLLPSGQPSETKEIVQLLTNTARLAKRLSP